MHYIVWHLDAGTLIGDYPTEAAALAAVRDEIQANASPALATRALRAGRSSALPERSPACN